MIDKQDLSHKKFVIAFILGVVAIVGNISADQEVSMIEYTFPNSPGYILVTSKAQYRDYLERTYYIAKRDTTVWPPRTVTLDSIQAFYATATDTNTFIFVCAEGQTNYLVVAKTSPEVRFDTIMTQGIDPPDNWLTDPELVTISPSSGIVAGSFEHGFSSGNYDIRRMNRDGTTTLLHTIMNSAPMKTSLDRSEFYFPILEDRDGVSYYELRVYDVTVDTFYVLRDPSYSISTPRRTTRGLPLYYVKTKGFDRQIWRMLPDGSHELGYSLKRAENVENIIEAMDSLVMVISNMYSDSTYEVVFEHYVRWKK